MVQILDEGSIVSPLSVFDHRVFKRLAVDPNQIRIFVNNIILSNFHYLDRFFVMTFIMKVMWMY